jgi:glycosyltransferase involved in cell wall biosynthesis
MIAAAIIPAFNEAETIGDVIRGLRGVVDHILIVDDGSTDATADVARAAGAEVLAHATNRGKGEAIRSAIAHVRPRGFTHVLVLDGDMQYLPAEAPRLLEAAARTGADVVLGERRFHRDRMPAARYHANRIGSKALSWFVGSQLIDTQCGYRVFRLAALDGVTLRATGYDIETEMLVKLSRRKAEIATVPSPPSDH